MTLPFLPQAKVFSGNWADWQLLIDEQHAEFVKQFVHGTPIFLSKNIGINFTMEEGKEASFWHIVTRGFEDTQDRDGEVQRAIRSHWVLPIIQNYLDPAITYFKYQDDRFVKHYFWLRAENYLVILDEKKSKFYLVTAYVVDKAGKIASLERKFKNRLP